DDGHVRVYSTKDLSSLQTLYDKTWGKVTTLTCLTINAAGNKVDMMELWVIPPVADAIPASLKFFGAGSQNILLTKIENGE
ncbi:hypothetical protein C0989_011665, partial [Termitomyces sp. Mn162]